MEVLRMFSIEIKFRRKYSKDVITEVFDDVISASAFFEELRADKTVTTATYTIINHNEVAAFHR